MTHTPPIPAGNQSPYPLQEPPHEHVEVTLPPIAAKDDSEDSLTSRLAELPLAAIGAAVGIGVALIGGVLLGLRGASTKAKPRGRAKPKRG